MIAAYLRVSLEEGERQTVETQRNEFKRDCELLKVPPSDVYKVYADDFTGTAPLAQRPSGKELLADARLGKFLELVVYKVDRLGRRASVILNAVEDLEKLGVRVRSLTESFDTAKPEGRLMLTMLSATAAFERDNIVMRTRHGSRRLASIGNYMGGTVPFGYRVEGEDKTAHLVPNDVLLPGHSLSEANIARKVYCLAADGKSCPYIANYLYETGIPTPRCHLGMRAQWTREMVRRILTNPVYKGVMTYGKRITTRNENGVRRFKAVPREDWIVASCPPLVDEELWEMANAALKRNQLAQMAHPKYQYLLSGLIRCAVCGRKFIGVGPRYRCAGRHGAKALGVQRCTGKTVRRAELEAAIWDDLQGFLKKPGLVIREFQRKLEATDGGRDQIREEIREIQKALSKLAEVETRNARHLNEQLFTRDQFEAERKRIEQQRASIEKRLAALRKDATDIDANVRILKSAESLLENFHLKAEGRADFPKRRQIAEALVDHITVEIIQGQKAPKLTVLYRFDSDFDRYVRFHRDTAKDEALHSAGVRTRRTWRLSDFSKPARSQS